MSNLRLSSGKADQRIWEFKTFGNMLCFTGGLNPASLFLADGPNKTEYCATVGEVEEVMAITDEEVSQGQQDMRFAIAFGPINVK